MLSRRLVQISLAMGLLLMANLRLCYTVGVGGDSAEGVFTPAQLRDSRRCALAAQEEVARCDEAAPAVCSVPRLTLRAPDGDTQLLTRHILERSDGVKRCWRVYVDGGDAGLCTDPTALGEVIEVIIARGAVEEAVSASLTGEVEVKPVFVPEEAEADLMTVAANIRGVTQVMSVTAEGLVRYG